MWRNNLCVFSIVSKSAYAVGHDTTNVAKHPVGGVSPAREQDSSVGGVAVVICLGVVHMEGGVQVRVQVEVGREEQGEGETHGEGQNEEQRSNEEQTLNRSSGWCDARMQTRSVARLEPCGVLVHH